MKLKRILTLCCMLTMALGMASSASAADYSFETSANPVYYDSTNYEDLYDAGYNYGARRPGRVRKSILIMSLLVFGYTAVMWSMIILIPETLIRIFSSDAALIQDAVPALNMYFAAFIFMDLQYIGQAVFKSLNKKVFAIFFSLLRKVFIVVPLTYFLPYAMHMGTDGVFLAEPVSNVIGGTACILTMLITIMPELKRIEVENRRAE